MRTAQVTAVETNWRSAFPRLASIEDQAWLDALQAASESRLPSGTMVIRKGDPCQHFILLIEGTIRVYEKADNGREIVLYRVQAGEICVLTITNLMEHTAYQADAVVESDSRVISMPLQHFQSAMAHSPAFRTFILTTLARRLSHMMRLVEQIAFQRLDLRLACLLGQLFGQRNASRIYVTHQELARELGTTREVTSRLLKEFERMGCVSLGRGRIDLISEDALVRLSRA